MVLGWKPDLTLQQSCSFPDNGHWYSFGTMKLFRCLSEWSICITEGFGWLIDSSRQICLGKTLVWTDVGRGNSLLPPLPRPLFQVFLEFLLALCLGAAFSSLMLKPGFTLMRNLLSPGTLGMQSFVLYTAPLNIDQQEVLWGASFLKLQNFKKEMKTRHCIWPDVQVPKCRLWLESKHLCPLSSLSCLLAPGSSPFSPHFSFICLWFCHCFTVFFMLYSHTPSAVAWCV